MNINTVDIDTFNFLVKLLREIGYRRTNIKTQEGNYSARYTCNFISLNLDYPTITVTLVVTYHFTTATTAYPYNGFTITSSTNTTMW